MGNIQDHDVTDSGIPHAELLTFVDKIKGNAHPITDTNSMSGQTTYPRRDYLTNVANQRKAEADAAAAAAKKTAGGGE